MNICALHTTHMLYMRMWQRLFTYDFTPDNISGAAAALKMEIFLLNVCLDIASFISNGITVSDHSKLKLIERRKRAASLPMLSQVYPDKNQVREDNIGIASAAAPAPSYPWPQSLAAFHGNNTPGVYGTYYASSMQSDWSIINLYILNSVLFSMATGVIENDKKSENHLINVYILCNYRPNRKGRVHFCD